MKLARWIGVGLLATLVLAAVFVFAAWRADRANRWSENLILGSPPLPERPGREDSFSLRDYTPSVRDSAENAYRSLQQRNFPTAAAHLREALASCLPDDATKRSYGPGAGSLLRVARGVSPLLPPGHLPLQVCRFPVAEAPEQWAVLSAQRRDYHDFREPRLSLFRHSGGDYQSTWQSDILRDPGFDQGYLVDIALYVTDLTGDGVPEAAVLEASPSGSDAPTHLDLFAWKDDVLVKAFGVGSHQPIWILDLNRDGRYEIGAYDCIGNTICHADMPRWHDIYAWKNGGYRLANGDFPNEFRDLEREITDLLREHPDDDELRDHLRSIHDFRRTHPTQAGALGRRMNSPAVQTKSPFGD